MEVRDVRPRDVSTVTRSRVWIRGLLGRIGHAWSDARQPSHGQLRIPELARMESILVVHRFGLGDVVQALPFLRALRRSAPRAEIAAIVRPDPWSAFAHLDWVDQWIRADDDWSARAAAREFRRSVGGCVDLGLLPFTGLSSGWVLAAAKPQYWAGYAWDLSVSANFSFEDARLLRIRHPREMALDVLRTMVDVPNDPMVPLTVPAKGLAQAEAVFAGALRGARMVVGMNPGSAAQSRRWPAARWAELAVRLYRKERIRTAVTGSAADLAICSEVVALASSAGVPIVDLSGKVDLPAWMALVKRMGVFVSVDAGPLHLARALGVPTVGLFGPVDGSLRSWPGPGHMDLQAEGLGCRPCHREEWSPSCMEPPCLTEIDIDRVIHSIMQQLACAA